MASPTADAAGTADAQLKSGRGRLLGLSARETADGAAKFVLRDGTSASGTPLAFFNLAAGESINGDWGSIDGIEFLAGLYLDRVSGTSEVTVYL